MNKTGIFLLCSSLFCSSLFAEESNIINEQENQIVSIEKNISSKSTCDLSEIKTAVAKLILKIDALEKKDKNLENQIVELNKLLLIKNENKVKEIKENSITKIEESKKEEKIIEISSDEKIFKVKSNKAFLYKSANYQDFAENKFDLKFGDEIISDKQNQYGWVHIKDKGWVRGYLLNPIFVK